MVLAVRKSSAPTRPLEPPDSHYVKAAQGWLELANPQAALEELNRVSPLGRAHPLFLFLRWELYATWRDWPTAHLLGQYLVELCPQEPLAWLQRAYSLFALKRTAEAFEQLLPAAQQFADSSVVAYHLACYASQLGNLQEAWHWLDQAITRGDGEAVKSMALEDPLLAPLWEHLCERLSPAPRE
jgi:tetratricopeptide (TPR) repeat protein